MLKHTLKPGDHLFCYGAINARVVATDATIKLQSKNQNKDTRSVNETSLSRFGFF